MSGSDPWAAFPPVPVQAQGAVDPWAAFPAAGAAAPAGAPARESGTAGRLVTQAAAGGNQAVVDLATLPVNLAQGALNLDRRILNAGIRGFDWLLGREEPTHQVPLYENSIGTSESVTGAAGEVARAVGVDPSVYEPRDASERVARGVGYGAVSAVAPGGLIMAGERAGIIGTQAASSAIGAIGRPDLLNAGLGASGGAGAELAQEAVSEPYKPLAGTIGGLLGGVAPIAAASGGRGLVTASDRLLLTDGARRRVAGETLRQAASDPDAVIRATAGGPDVLVPGAVPTVGEQTADVGLLALERGDRVANPGRYNERDTARGAALSREVQGVGGEGSAADAQALAAQRARDVDAAAAQRVQDAEAVAGREVTQAEQQAAARVEAVAQRFAAEVQAGRMTADQAAARLGGAGYPDEYGARLRELLAPRYAANKVRDSAAFQSVDRTGDSQLPLGGVQTRARELEAQYFGGRLGGGVPPQLAPIFDDIARVGDAPVTFAEIQGLRRRLGAIAGDPNGDPRAKSVAAQLREELDATTERAALPTERPSTAPTLDDLERQASREAAAQNPDIADRLALERRDLEASGGAEAAPGGLSLVQFLRQQGGIQNTGGDAMFLMGGTARTMPGLVNGRGLTLDNAVERAVQDGFLPPGATQRDLLDAVAEELQRGERRYAGRRTWNPDERGRTVADDLDQEITERGGAYVPDDPDATLRSLPVRDESLPAGEAVPERFEVLERAFTPEQAERYRQATAFRRETGEKFERGAVGEVLRRGPFGAYALSEGNIPARFFGSGPGVRQNVQQLKGSVGDDAAAEILSDYAVSQLRRAAGPGGRLTPQAVDRWLLQNEGALSELPGLRERILAARDAEAAVIAREAEGVTATRQAEEEGRQAVRDADRAGRARTNEAERVARQERLDFERSGLGSMLKVGDPSEVPAVVGRLLGGPAPLTAMRNLARQVGDNAAAREGVRRALADYLAKRSLGINTAGLSDQPAVQGAAFRKFLRDNRRALAEFLSPEDMTRLGRVAAEIERGTRLAATQTVAGSATAQNTAAVRRAGSILSRLTGFGVGGPYGYLAVELGSALRSRGIESTARLVTDAILDPALARVLLLDATEANQKRAAKAIAAMQRGATQTLAITNQTEAP